MIVLGQKIREGCQTPPPPLIKVKGVEIKLLHRVLHVTIYISLIF